MSGWPLQTLLLVSLLITPDYVLLLVVKHANSCLLSILLELPTRSTYLYVIRVARENDARFCMRPDQGPLP